MNVPNFLTSVRFLLIPILAYFMYVEQFISAVLILFLSGVTDFLDGYIARKYGLVTSWGKIMDPMADKLIQISALVMLGVKNLIPLYLIYIVFIKEILMGIGFIGLLRSNIIVSSSWYGKVATILFYLAITFALLDIPYYVHLVFVAVMFTLFALVMYFINYIKLKSNSTKIKEI